MKIFATIFTVLFLANPLFAQDNIPTESTSADKALLIVLRPVGGGFVFSTSINNELLGLTRGGDFLYKEIDPGVIELLTAGGEGSHTLSVDVKAGNVYFIKIRHKAGFIAPKLDMKIMDNEWGWNKIQDLKMGTHTSSAYVSED